MIFSYSDILFSAKFRCSNASFFSFSSSMQCYLIWLFSIFSISNLFCNFAFDSLDSSYRLERASLVASSYCMFSSFSLLSWLTCFSILAFSSNTWNTFNCRPSIWFYFFFQCISRVLFSCWTPLSCPLRYWI